MARGLASHGNCLKNEKDIRHNYKYKTDIKRRRKTKSIKLKEVLKVYFFALWWLDGLSVEVTILKD